MQEFRNLISVLVEFLIIVLQKISNVDVDLNSLQFVVLILLLIKVDVLWSAVELMFKMKVLVCKNVVVPKLINLFVVWIEKLT